MTTTWKPILDGDLAERAQQAIDSIAQELIFPPERPPTASSSHRDKALASPTLASGSSGVALFFDALDRARPGEGWDEAAEAMLEHAIEDLAEWPLTAGLFSGFTGVGWVIEHLLADSTDSTDSANPPTADQAPDEIQGFDEEDLCEPIDQSLLALLERSDLPIGHDLFNGLSGWGFYALERFRNPLIDSGADLMLDCILERLEADAYELEPGIAWLSPASPDKGDGQPAALREHFGLGMAHGVPGVCVFLARLCEAEGDTVRARRAAGLLESALAWIMAQQLDREADRAQTDRVRADRSKTASFPAAVCLEGQPIEGRPAWCAGDPGIAAALVAAGGASGNSTLRDQALELARRTARFGLPAKTLRTETDRTAIVDSCLCHGSAGLGHIYHRLAVISDEADFRRAARAWFGDALDGYRARRRTGTTNALGAFPTLIPRDDGTVEWRSEPGFLLGAAGVGLALISATYAVEPTWDRLLGLPAHASRPAHSAASQPARVEAVSTL